MKVTVSNFGNILVTEEGDSYPVLIDFMKGKIKGLVQEIECDYITGIMTMTILGKADSEVMSHIIEKMVMKK